MALVIVGQKHDVDRLAERIAWLARYAKSMPASFDAGGTADPVYGLSRVGDVGGRCVGHMLPGRGFLLNSDLKRLGITKKIPHVIERSPFRRLLDLVVGKRGAITTFDGIVAARGAGKADDFASQKPTLTTVASQWSSLSQLAGNPAAYTYVNIPGGEAPDVTKTGCLNWCMTDPTGGDTKYLLSFGYTSAQQINWLMLVDLLVAAGNVLATTLAAQTINTTALTRYTNGIGVMATTEVTTAIGTTASNFTLSAYHNSAAVGSRASVSTAMTVSMIVGRLSPVAFGAFIQLQSGDVGIQSVETITLSAAMSAGKFALNLYKPLVWMPGIAANVYLEKATTSQISGLVQLPTTAGGHIGCLQVYAFTNTTSTGVVVTTYSSCAG